MGNLHSSREQIKKDYDVIYHIQSVMDIDVGWPITFPNPVLREMYLPDKNEGNDPLKNPLKQNVKWDSNLVSIQGQHKSGKTFVLNLLTGLEIPKETNGLSIKMSKVNERNIAFMDTAGSNTPIIPITTKECNLQIEEKRGTEMFLRDLCISSSDMNILIVGDTYSEMDQSTLLKMANTLLQKIKKEREIKKTQKIKNYQKTKPEILVVHNFKTSGFEEAEQKWKKVVNEMAKYASLLLSEPLHPPHQPLHQKLPTLEDEDDKKLEIDEIISENSFALSNQADSNQVDDLFNLELSDEKMVHRMEYTEEMDGETIKFVHFFVCQHQSQEDIEYNKLVAHNINSWISSGSPPKEIVINPLGFISSMIDLNINNYVTGTEKMGFYHLSEPLCLFYHYLQNPQVYISGFPLSKMDEEKRIRENLFKFHLQFEKSLSSHYSLLELKNILKWSVNQCEQLREWMLTSRERKVNGIPFDLFPRLYLLKWDEFVDQMWNHPIDFLLLYSISQVLKYRVVIITSCIKCPVFVFSPEKTSYRDTLYFSFARLGADSFYSRLIPNEQLHKKMENNDREHKIKKFTHLELLTFRSNENSKEKKLFGGKSLLKSSFVSSSLSSLFDYNQQFMVKYTTEINKKDNSLRIVIDVPYSSNDYLEYDCTLLQDPKRFKLEVKGRRELDEDWVVSEGTRKFGDWSFCYEIPKQYTIEQPDIAYTSGTLIFTFRYGEVQSTLKKIIRRAN